MSSGTSTPRLTPTEAPSPLMVGTHFVKQYYKVLSSTPEQIFRFYEPSSVLSQGVGSQPTQPATFETVQDAVPSRFQQEGLEDCPIRFEFEHGAIDAQLAVNGGVLLVVTGHVVYLAEHETRKAFVHTFFLGSMTKGTKRSYYVHNDVLRFLADAMIGQGAETETLPMTQTDEEAPGGGVEETKEPMPEEKSTPIKVVDNETNIIHEEPTNGIERKEETTNVQENILTKEETTKEEVEEEYAVEKPKVAPGSWASLVAGSSPASTPPTPQATPTRAKPKTVPVAVASSPPAEPRRTVKRDPDFTLVIKNIDAATTEADIHGVFEPFAKNNEANLVGCTVSAAKGIAFVDYDSANPVLAAVATHAREPIELHGRVLDVYQKSIEQRGGRRNQGSGRSGRHVKRSGGGRSERGGGRGRGAGR